MDPASDNAGGEDMSANAPRTPIKASQLWLAVGLTVAGVTVLSGLASLFFNFEDDSEVTREVFENIPSPLKLGFYTVIPLLLVWGSVQLSYRVKNWERGAPDRRTTNRKNFKKRMADFRSGVYMQTLMREPGAGIMHSLIYFNFIIHRSDFNSLII